MKRSKSASRRSRQSRRGNVRTAYSFAGRNRPESRVVGEEDPEERVDWLASVSLSIGMSVGVPCISRAEVDSGYHRARPVELDSRAGFVSDSIGHIGTDAWGDSKSSDLGLRAYELSALRIEDPARLTTVESVERCCNEPAFAEREGAISGLPSPLKSATAI